MRLGGMAAHLGGGTEEDGSFAQGETQAQRVRLLRQGHGFLPPCQRLVRIAKIPQRPGVAATTRHPNVLPVEERRSTVLGGGSYRAIPCANACAPRRPLPA